MRPTTILGPRDPGTIKHPKHRKRAFTRKVKSRVIDTADWTAGETIDHSDMVADLADHKPPSDEDRQEMADASEQLSPEYKDEAGQKLWHAVVAVREQVNAIEASCWELARRVVALKRAYETMHAGKRLTNKQLAHMVRRPQLSSTRVGQLVTGAEYYHGVEPDETIALRIYEKARLMNLRDRNLSPVQLNVLIKKARTLNAIEQLLLPVPPQPVARDKHKLAITVTFDWNLCQKSVSVLWDGQPHVYADDKPIFDKAVAAVSTAVQAMVTLDTRGNELAKMNERGTPADPADDPWAPDGPPARHDNPPPTEQQMPN